MQSAAMLSDNDRIDMSVLPEHLLRANAEDGRALPEIQSGRADEARIATVSKAPFEPERPTDESPLLLDEIIKRTLMRSLERTDGNRRRAADLLGVSRSTLYRMLSRYGLADEALRRHAAPSLANPASRRGAG
jgi:transcriptional regulator of acetoin/glycerol metabolism